MVFLINTSVLPRVRFLGSINYRKPWKHFSRVLDEYVLYIVKSGDLYLREGETDWALTRGDALLLEPGLLHAGTRPACCEYWFIHFKSDGIQRLPGDANDNAAQQALEHRRAFLSHDPLDEADAANPNCLLPKAYNYSGAGIQLAISGIMNESIEEYKGRSEDYKNLISSNLLKLLILLSREFVTTSVEKNEAHFPKPSIKATEIMNFIHREYRRNIDSAFIEREFDGNYDYLNRIFHTYTGYSIQHYLNLTRIGKAKELIASTPYKFMDICSMVGIENPYYFSRLFKKYTGMPPMQYLKIMRARELEP